ncbi:MAG: sensor histidine kinase KdpD [Alphaproteobacteria bacterium]|nr:sensor histidine kinase KdpD [Alphaproteobacteria bacterium]
MSDEHRPSPEALLAEAVKEGRGRLKIFLGAAPGVGKTYAMLEAARRRKAEGIDVVAGVVETHGRSETQRLLAGLEVLPPAHLPYGGRILTEMNLDGLLARRPQLALVDELAHTNVTGSRHPKRWQDVEELLAVGVDVYATLNIQHLESLNDVIERISRVRVRETLPDSVLEMADEIELIDLPPEELIERLRQGKVYVRDQIARAITNFFSKGNLTALRELAMRVAADRVDAQMMVHMRAHAIAGPWPTQERILVCISESLSAGTLVRSARRMADRARVPWIAVNVSTPAREHLSDAAKDAIADALRLAQSLGAEVITLNAESDVADEILELAQKRNVSRIVVGRARPRLWFSHLGRESVAEELIRKASGFEVTIVSGEQQDGAVLPPSFGFARPERNPRSYLWATGAVTAAGIISILVNQIFPVESLSLFFLLAVLTVAARLGLWPSVYASILSFLAYNFFLTEPYFTFHVANRGVILTLFLFLATAIVTGNLAARLRDQANTQRAIARRTSNLFEFSRKVAAAAGRDDVVWAAVHHVAATLQCASILLMPNSAGALEVVGGYPPEDSLETRDQGAADWAWQHQEAAGWGSATLPASQWLFLPIVARETRLGVLGVHFERQRAMDPESRRVLDALVDQIALALERTALALDMEEARLLTETESLRAALLSSISHDLRTPLVSIIGAASTLLESDAVLGTDGRHVLAETVRDEGERLNRYVQNLLDMTRLGYGALKIKRQPIDLRELAGRAEARLASVLAGRSVAKSLPPALPDAAGDPVLIEQVLVNILDNAAKYSPPSAPIAISAREERGAIALTIADSGPGISREDRDNIFDMFYRARAGDGQPTGTGLGLAISKGIVEAHGGSIRALQTSSMGTGTVIEIILPVYVDPVRVTEGE